MKNKVLLLAITIVAVAAMAFAMSGCSCKDSKKETTKFDPNKVPTANAKVAGDGNMVVDDFPTISATEKVTNKKGDTVIRYTSSDGNKVERVITKDGYIKVTIWDKNGKVIKKKKFKNKMEKVDTKDGDNKTTKKSDKKETTKKGSPKAGVANDDDGSWSDFY